MSKTDPFQKGVTIYLGSMGGGGGGGGEGGTVPSGGHIKLYCNPGFAAQSVLPVQGWAPPYPGPPDNRNGEGYVTIGD